MDEFVCLPYLQLFSGSKIWIAEIPTVYLMRIISYLFRHPHGDIDTQKGSLYTHEAGFIPSTV